MSQVLCFINHARLHTEIHMKKIYCSWHYKRNIMGNQFTFIISTRYSMDTSLIWSKIKQHDDYQLLPLISYYISVFRILGPWNSMIVRCNPGNNNTIVFKAVSLYHPFIFYSPYIKIYQHSIWSHAAENSQRERWMFLFPARPCKILS